MLSRWRDADARRALVAGGACWGFIAEKHRFILFGTYPFEQHWRPAASTLLLISLWGFSLVRIFWRWWLALVWVAGLTVIDPIVAAPARTPAALVKHSGHMAPPDCPANPSSRFAGAICCLLS